MSSTILLSHPDSNREKKGVAYAEEAARSRDGVPGVAIQYVDDQTEFIEKAEIIGVYGEETDFPFTDDYDQLLK